MKMALFWMWLSGFFFGFAATKILLPILFLNTAADNPQPVQQKDVFGASQYGTERDNQEIIHEELGGEMEWRLDDGTRIDLVLEDPKRTIEIDWDKKWAEGIGQAIYYMMKLNEQNLELQKQSGVMNVDPSNFYQPLVILLAKGSDSGWEKYRDRVEFCKMRCWVFDAQTKTWLDKED